MKFLCHFSIVSATPQPIINWQIDRLPNVLQLLFNNEIYLNRKTSLWEPGVRVPKHLREMVEELLSNRWMDYDLDWQEEVMSTVI